MRLSPDEMIFWQHGFLKLNATIVFTWGLMLVLTVSSKLITRKLSTGLKRSRWQNLLEIVVTGIEKQIEEVGLSQPQKYLGFLGTLFLFVATASLCTVIPGYQPPTGSLSTRECQECFAHFYWSIIWLSFVEALLLLGAPLRGPRVIGRSGCVLYLLGLLTLQFIKMIHVQVASRAPFCADDVS